MTNDEARRTRMQEIAKTVDSMIPEGFGFAIMVFEFDETEAEYSGKEMHWISNADRNDMVRAMQEFISREAN